MDPDKVVVNHMPSIWPESKKEKAKMRVVSDKAVILE
jgi:hypothetical protein